jgi:hypothetical protein
MLTMKNIAEAPERYYLPFSPSTCLLGRGIKKKTKKRATTI